MMSQLSVYVRMEYLFLTLAVWLSGNALALINVVAHIRQTWLVPGWVTVYGRVNHLGMLPAN